jgi:hypothetical protein
MTQVRATRTRPHSPPGTARHASTQPPPTIAEQRGASAGCDGEAFVLAAMGQVLA